MAKCKLCNNPVSRKPEAYALFYCDPHFLKWLARKQKKLQPPVIHSCKHCGKPIYKIRNKTYCDDICAAADRRVINDDHITLVINHSYWANIQNLYKNSPLKITSSEDVLTDIPELWNLYSLKARYQASFNAFDGEILLDPITRLPVEKLTVSIRLELCHRFPNALGGANTAMNIVIGPAFINRILGNRVSPTNNDDRFNGIKIVGTAEELVGNSLAQTLKVKYSTGDIGKMMKRIKPGYASIKKIRHWKNPGSEPLFSILYQECKRLGFSRLQTKLNYIKVDYGNALGLHLEAIAVAFFIALQTQDAEGLILITEKILFDVSWKLRATGVYLYMKAQNIRNPLPVYEGSPLHTLLCAANVVLQKYCNVDLFESIQTTFLKLYNSAFYKPPEQWYSPLILIPRTNPWHKLHPDYNTSSDELVW
ncbi:hypothetical protein [Citrobacter portucalensis]|uniref:hypothetical protein n=1 Tax=Citrobacter portucalensis TaxID=1639133 RepID=UPI0039F62034